MIRMPPRCAGLGLMEVLAACAVLTSGLLCLLQLQVVAQQLDIASRQRAEASLLMNELSERLLMLRQLSVFPSALFVDSASTRCGAEPYCPAADFAHDDMVLWRLQVVRRLPDARIQGEWLALPSGLWSSSVTLSWSGGSHSQTVLW